jgi:CDP-diacylglycerol---glycerol-3-phosphate 3-phosphatidyltransferase
MTIGNHITYNGRRLAQMNLPNTLTLARLFLVPLLVVVLLTKFEGRLVLGVRKELVGAAIFGIASLTDFLDGYLARRRKQVTTLGQLMDPLADKLLITAALVSLVQMDLAPAWMVAVILGREFAVTVLRSVAHARGVSIPASPLGKFKMATEVLAILLLILGREHLQGFFVLGQAALWVAMVAAVVSGIDYYRRFQQVLSPKPLPVERDEIAGVHRVPRPLQSDHGRFGAHRDRRAAGD